jgi:PGF-pre-PGF domain-containing protein
MTNVSARERYCFEIKAIRLSLTVALLFLFSTARVDAQSCVTPVNDRYIDNDTTLCSGEYTINDSGAGGILIINTSNITLDCNGSIINNGGSGNPTKIGIESYTKSNSNVTIRNCDIRGFNFQIRGKTLKNSRIIDNNLSCTSGSTAFRVQTSSNDNFIANNTIGGQCLTGLQIDGGAGTPSLNATLKNNTIRLPNPSGSTGISLCGENCDNITIEDNFISATSGGISFELSKGVRVINNTIDGGTGGIRFKPVTGLGSVDNIIYKNRFFNHSYGIAFDDDLNTNNTVYLNTFINNTQHATSVVSGNFFNFSGMGNYWDDLNASNFTDTNSDGFYDSGVGYPYNATNGGKVSASVEDYYPCVYKNCIGLTSFSPSNGTYTNSKSISLSARSNQNISNVSIKINGTNSSSLSFSSCTGTNEVSCSYSEQSLSQGLNNITINVTDTDGINASFYRNFTFDDVAPAAPTINSAPSSTSDSSVVLSGGNSSDTASVVISGGASNVTATFVSSWKATVPLNCGSNSLTVKAADLAGNANAASVSITRNCATPSSGSSDSTGITQSKSAGIQPSTVEAASRQYVSITDTSQPTVVTFDKTEVSAIELKVTEAVSQATVSVQSLSALPSGVPAPASPSYSYLSISVAKSLGDKISEAKVSFKVAKSWITENEIDTGMVALNKYGETSGSWISLPTTKKSESETEVNYEAQTTGFSIFAITGEKVKETTAVPTTPTPSPVSTPEATATQTYIKTPVETPAEMPKLPVLWIVFAIVVFLAVVYLLWRRLRL